MREYLRWIHLSDVHFKWSDKFKQEDALKAVRRDVVKRAQHGFQPDLILVTGDLAYTGAAAEYGPVAQFLGELANELRLSRRNILVCPGNHDVDRSRCPVVREGCVLSLRSISDTTEFLCSEELAHIKTRQSGYDEFVAGFYDGNVALQYDPTGLHLYREVEIEDVIVSILAVNSSWLCKGGEDDQGKLQVGFSVVERFVEEQKGPTPTFRYF